MKLDGTTLKTARLQRFMNQRQVAKKTKLSLMTICNAENEKDIHPATAKILCDFFEFDIAEVMLPLNRSGDGDAA